MIHNLKILPEHFTPVLDGLKLAELRKNDRNFQVGDILVLYDVLLSMRGTNETNNIPSK